MTKKRKQPDSNPSDTIFTSKRSRPNQADGNDDSPSAAQPRLDPTYGQRGAFPGLDDPVGEDELFYGPANDGMEYLRMVRSEAKTVPNLLVAPTNAPAEQDIYSDYPQGYYADGAYTATPLPSAQRRASDEADSDLDAQDAYYAALPTRFLSLSNHLRSPPALPANGILNIPAGFNTSKEWRNKILRTSPKMGILALLQQEMVIKGLEVLEDLLTTGNLNGRMGKGVGAWAWGLLARCREVGMMGSEEVGVVRRVGKKAVWLLRRLRAGSVVENVVEDVVVGGQSQREDDDEDEDEDDKAEEEVHLAEELQEGEVENDTDSVAALDPITSVTESSAHLLSPPAEEGVDSALADARARMLASLESTDRMQGENQQRRDSKDDTVDKETVHATLDMIVTIVGEFYGQRDLLDGRLLWDEMP